MSLSLFHQNRAFNVRLRDLVYRRAHTHFHAVAEKLRQPKLSEKEGLRRLDAFIVDLQETYEHASEAIRGLKRRKLSMFREDSVYGILEEEVVLCHFLEEMLSNSRFLRARLNTDLKMRLYRHRLVRIQTQVPEGDGFINRILETVNRFQDTEWMAISQVLELMEQRWQVGHDLFEIIRQKLQHLMKDPAK